MNKTQTPVKADPLLDKFQAAELMHVNPQFILSLMAEQKLAYVVPTGTANGKRFVRQSEITRWLDANTTPALDRAA